MSDKEKMWKVYRYWIVLNGEEWSYVGCTKLRYRADRAGNIKTGKKYLRCPKFGTAIKQYGFSSFSYEVIEEGLSQEEAYEREQYWIQFYNSIEHGFNLTKGGLGSLGIQQSEELKRKRANARKKPIICLNEEGLILKRYLSAKDAEDQTGISRSHICQVLKGSRKKAGGFHWAYETN